MSRILFILLAAVSFAIAAEPTNGDILATIRRCVPSAAPAAPVDHPEQAFTGEFTQSPEVAQRAGAAMAGNHLHLFSDHTYIYLEWADILPPTIYDKGAWSFDGHVIRLETDNTVPQKYACQDKVYAPITAEISGAKQLFLIGIDREYCYFQENAKLGDDFMFLLCFRARVAPSGNDAATKAKLMKDAWRPDFFRR